jgi:magnesium transporter
MIRVKVHTDRDGLHDAGSLGDVALHTVSDADLLWIDVVDPQPQEMERIGQEFGLHPLSVEDAVRRHQRPKIELHEGYLFIVFYALDLVADRPRATELSLFSGKGWVVTVHEGELPAIAETARRWEEHAFGGHTPGAGLLVYALLDSIVDGYFPVVDAVAERAEALEDAIFSGGQGTSQEGLFALKKDLLAIRRIVGPERDVMNVLVRRDAPLFTRKEITYFQDVYDHILRITDAIDLYRDLLSSALDASLSMTSYRLNNTVKRMTSGSIILMSMALVSGIYGMNFVNMPELDWQFGYPMALALMATIGGGLAWFFHRIDWL